MVGQHHRLNGHESEQTPGGCEGQGSLVCCSPWGRKESDMTQQLNNNNNIPHLVLLTIHGGSYCLHVADGKTETREVQ